MNDGMSTSIAPAPMDFQKEGAHPAASYGALPGVQDCSVKAMPSPQTRIFRPNRRAVRSIRIAGPAGKLEAVLNESTGDARFAALVCHPHPLGGGNLHNKIVYHAMKVLNDSEWGMGCPVLRFNFRGTGASEGAHDGTAESGDVVAAMDWLEREFRMPLIVAGFSFGAAMALRACSEQASVQRNVRALVALGLPLEARGRSYQYGSLKNLPIPKLFLSGDCDEFAPAQQLTEVVAASAAPKRLIFIPGADHFFLHRLQPMQNALAGWLKEQLP